MVYSDQGEEMFKEPVYVRLTNRIAFLKATPDILAEMKQYFRYRPPGYKFSDKYRLGIWDGYISLLRRGNVATGLFLAQREILEKKYELTVRDERAFPTIQLSPELPDIREYQKQTVGAMLAHSNTGGLVIEATGSGKTYTIGVFFRAIAGAVVFIVDELSLLEQARLELTAVVGEEIGVVGRSEFRPKRVSVATIQTLHRNRDRKEFQSWFRKLEVVVIDEVHLALNRRNLDVIYTAEPLAVFGLTATLELQKDHVKIPATALTGPVIATYTMQEGTSEGVLSEGRILRVLFHDPLKGPAPGYASEFKKNKIFIPPGSSIAEYRYRIALNSARNACIEDLVREGVSQGERVVVLVEQIRHLHSLSKRLKDLPHRVLSGAYSQDDRIAAMTAMDAGETNLILASRIFSKGVNIKSISMIIDATGAPSRNNAIQRYGRGVRTSPGKKRLLYLDISDVGKHFQGAAISRLLALRELGVPITEVEWRGNAREILREPDFPLEAASQAS